MTGVLWEGLSPPYSTIVADPPWAYATKAGITTPGRHRHRLAAANERYGSMSIPEMCVLPVSDIAATDSHVYLWTTNPRIFEAKTVLDAWGFRYVTLITWLKTGNMGMGFYFRGDTEHVLFGVRGKLPNSPADRQRNWFQAPKRGHSVKPPAFLDIVEAVSPGPYVELFARQPRLGWDHWGHGFESGVAA